MNTSTGNPLAPAVAGSQIAADQLAAQRAKRELRKTRADSTLDVRAIEDPVAIDEINDQNKDEPPPERKKKKRKDGNDEHKLDVTA